MLYINAVKQAMMSRRRIGNHLNHDLYTAVVLMVHIINILRSCRCVSNAPPQFLFAVFICMDILFKCLFTFSHVVDQTAQCHDLRKAASPAFFLT